ncbi:MAG: hypothetical protein E7359_03810 [Clostridiales bacterium]|nr:hypothetical protein [Clostridiales bacterium]
MSEEKINFVLQDLEWYIGEKNINGKMEYVCVPFISSKDGFHIKIFYFDNYNQKIYKLPNFDTVKTNFNNEMNKILKCNNGESLNAIFTLELIGKSFKPSEIDNLMKSVVTIDDVYYITKLVEKKFNPKTKIKMSKKFNPISSENYKKISDESRDF